MARGLAGKDSIYVHVRAAHCLCNSGHAMALHGHFRWLIAVDATLAAQIGALRFGHFYALALTLFDETTFHLRHHAENRHDNSAGFAARGHVRVKDGDERLSLVAFDGDGADPERAHLRKAHRRACIARLGGHWAKLSAAGKNISSLDISVMNAPEAEKSSSR